VWQLRIAIIGAGAIGGFFGSLLYTNGHEVIFVEREYKIPKLSSEGLKVEMPDSSVITVKAVFKPNLKGIKGLDMCIVAVKAYDTSAAVEHIVEANVECPVLLLQNGLGVEEEAERILKRPVARGVTNCGAMAEGIGNVKVKGIAKTLLGSRDPSLVDACKILAEALNEAGLPTEVTSNIDGAVWTKTIVNSSINPLGTIMNMKNGELLENEFTRELMAMIATESWRIAWKMGVKLEVEDPIEEVFRVARATYNNKNSMLMDLLKGKRTEIDYINGAIWRLSAKCLTSAPLNKAMYFIVKGLELARLKGSNKINL